MRLASSIRLLAALVLATAACSGDSAPPSDSGRDAPPVDLALDQRVGRDGAADRGPLDTTPGVDGADLGADTQPSDDATPDAKADSAMPPKPMKLYFKKPASWSAAYIHYWNSWPGNQASSWPGTPMQAEGGGWYSYTIAGATSAGVVFNDGGKSEQTIDLFRVGAGYFVPTAKTSGTQANGQPAQVKHVGRWTDDDPDTHPTIRAYPSGGVFYGASVGVELGAASGAAAITARRYTTDGSDPETGGTPFVDGQSITIGGGLAPGKTLTLRLYAATASGKSERSFTFSKKAAIPVEAWKPTNKPASVSQSGRWVELKDFNNDQGLGARNVTIYLPADYASKPQRRYRVVYFHDGQNLFRPQSATFGQEWMVDEHYDELIAEDLIDPVIFVGIWSAGDGATRTKEYVGGCGHGDAKAQYAAWVIHSLKPYIDHHYRTRPQREFTTTMGSSFGGIISYYLSWNHPDVFGGAGCVSTAFHCGGGPMLTTLLGYQGPKKDVRYWIDGGFDEGTKLASGRTSYVQNNRLFAEKLASLGWRENDDLGFVEAVGANHSETAWSRRIKQILYFLLRREAPAIAHVQVRTALDPLSPGGSTYASIDARYENGPLLTKVFADGSKPASFTVKPAGAGVISVSAQDGEVTASKVGRVTLEGSYQGFSASTKVEVK